VTFNWLSKCLKPKLVIEVIINLIETTVCINNLAYANTLVLV